MKIIPGKKSKGARSEVNYAMFRLRRTTWSLTQPIFQKGITLKSIINTEMQY